MGRASIVPETLRGLRRTVREYAVLEGWFLGVEGLGEITDV
jgi:hypothetical protein